MIFLRNRIDFTFRTKKSPNVECGLGDHFYILIFGDNTVIYKNKSEKICYPIPVNYPSFVLSFVGRQTKLDEIFIFKNEEDRNKMELYVKTTTFSKAKLIKEFTDLK